MAWHRRVNASWDALMGGGLKSRWGGVMIVMNQGARQPLMGRCWCMTHRQPVHHCTNLRTLTLPSQQTRSPMEAALCSGWGKGAGRVFLCAMSLFWPEGELFIHDHAGQRVVLMHYTFTSGDLWITDGWSHCAHRELPAHEHPPSVQDISPLPGDMLLFLRCFKLLSMECLFLQPCQKHILWPLDRCD